MSETQTENSKAMENALKKVEQAKANLARVKREEKQKLRKEQDHHKFIMGGLIVKYFPDCYNFTEQEMNRIIACAFKNKDVLNMISVVEKDRNVETAYLYSEESQHAAPANP